MLLTFLIYSFYTLYSVFDACGLKILPQVAVVEIFPSRTCALGVSMAFATNWLAFNLVFNVTLLFQFVGVLGKGGGKGGGKDGGKADAKKES